MRNLYVRQKGDGRKLPFTPRIGVPEMKGTAPRPFQGLSRPPYWVGGGGLSLLCRVYLSGLASGQGEVHHYFRIHFDRLAIQQIWLVSPLLHRIDGGWSQHGMPAHQGQTLDDTILADLCVQHHRSLNARLARQRRIDRFHVFHLQTIGDARRNPNTLWRRDFGHRYRRGTDNAADHTAHLAARNAAGNAADDAARRHCWRRSFLFLNHLNLLGNLGGRAQSAVHDIGLNLLHDFNRSSSRRWRRWRRRGGHQKAHGHLFWQGFGEDEG